MAAVDVDAVLALLDLLTDDGPVVVVFLPIVYYQNTESSNVVNRLQNQETEPAIREMKNSLTSTAPICKLVTHQQKAFSTFEASMEVELYGDRVARGGGK